MKGYLPNNEDNTKEIDIKYLPANQVLYVAGHTTLRTPRYPVVENPDNLLEHQIIGSWIKKEFKLPRELKTYSREIHYL